MKWSLPDAHTDFIIAVAAEEYGLVLVLIIIALYTPIVVRSLLRLMRERDPFIRLAGTGLACIFGVQAMINMGVAVRLLPAKGMTLPFVSYGGSSLIAGGIARRHAAGLHPDPPAGRARRSLARAVAMSQPLAADRRGWHRRAHVPGPGAGRGDAGSAAGGCSSRPTRAARATRADFPTRPRSARSPAPPSRAAAPSRKALVAPRIAAGVLAAAVADAPRPARRGGRLRRLSRRSRRWRRRCC